MRNAEPLDIAEKAFVCDGHRYEIYAFQVKFPDYHTLYLGWRKPLTSDHRTPVVLKRFPAPEENERRERCWEELQIATHLKHENITPVHCLANSPDRTLYVVMESMPGLYLLTALDFALLVGRRFSPAFCAYVAAEVANALDYAHKRKDNQGEKLHIIHRAISPFSIRLGFDGRVRLGNFGSAFSRLRDRLATPANILRGDAAYTAPEVWRSVMPAPWTKLEPFDGRADVFSLGLVLLEMLLAEYPLDPSDKYEFERPSSAAAQVKTERSTWIEPGILAERVLRFDADAIEARSESLPKGLRSVVRRALFPTPAERIDAATMRDELRAYLRSLGSPYGAQELAADLEALGTAVRRTRRLLARPIERTALAPDEE